ncbi:BlaI/MecI/CopY family transcriptional regulator [Frateuria edaphi]|jgi:predicted transcriptional regulator|uniref:BlaI/MecI/CopY family transcriptional regulator n=1 Tax=Frateuria TaxID=70411 RepID=UPI001E32E998|nr:BlaI/MecI/CopY family transcriptional regulator [Frateuria edaphi]UGB44229.1 BlaI/MecI/CopY family transcriptional regulator [Frateuria edaphi]
MTNVRPTEGELAILQVLWDRREPCTVREVHEALSRHKDTAYTTVLKMMTIMAEKGLVRRDESERSHRYVAAHPQANVQSALVKDLVQRAFSGSALQLVQRALDVEGASREELDDIAQLIARARKQRDR